MSSRKVERREYLIRGRVQGVAFRYYTRQKAGALDLAGWVRNEPDGSVAVVAEGSPPSLDQFGLWLHKGPPAARVDSVILRSSERVLPYYSHFSISH